MTMSWLYGNDKNVLFYFKNPIKFAGCAFSSKSVVKYIKDVLNYLGGTFHRAIHGKNNC
jgi:hypothetical protein